jgi:gamma-glutamyl-gamma-aminobutyrate hydrolase PuuD
MIGREESMKKGVGRLLLSVCVASFLAPFAVEACSVIVVGKKASTTGRVIVGHNDDNAGRIAVRYGWVPARAWPAGSVLPAEEGRAAVPQVQKTLGFFWSELKKPTGCVTNADTFLNECGVLVVTDNAMKTKESLDDPSRLSEGGIHYNLRRCVGERARSAREAVRIIGEMVERYGYVPSGRIYTVADADEAWQVQVVSGRHYVAMRCPDDSLCVTPNHYTIHELPPTPTDDCKFSPDIVSYAVAKGWWEAARPFDFAMAYQDPSNVMRPWNVRRQTYGTSLLLGREWKSATCPFSVKAERKVSPADVMKALSSHPDGVVPHDGDADSPALCRKATNESLVCDFGATPRETVLHIAGQPPCEGGYTAIKPLVLPLPAAFDDGRAPERLARHFQPEPDLFPKPLVVGIADRCMRPAGPQTDYIDALAKVGHIPMIIGRCKDPERIAKALSGIDILLLSGGEDVCTARYGEKLGPSCEPALDRDEFEYLLLEEAVKVRKPVFGICRGVQLMNVFFGGTLYRDIPTEYAPPAGAAACSHRFGNWADAGKGPPAHDVVIEKNSRLFAVTGAERLAVNSHHHQGVKALAPGFRVSARATDGFVEAIEGDSYPAAGVQFHPEALVVGRPFDPRYNLTGLAAILKDIGRVVGK